ncbi:hypothetical protein TI06_22940, partial [Vibrio vulnificus]
LRGEGNQRAGEDIGDQHVGLSLRQVRRQVDREPRGLDTVARGIVARGFQGLWIDVGADRPFGAEQQRGDGEDSRAAAEVEHLPAGQFLAVEPFQAQRGGRVGAGAEGQ